MRVPSALSQVFLVILLIAVNCQTSPAVDSEDRFAPPTHNTRVTQSADAQPPVLQTGPSAAAQTDSRNIDRTSQPSRNGPVKSDVYSDDHHTHLTRDTRATQSADAQTSVLQTGPSAAAQTDFNDVHHDSNDIDRKLTIDKKSLKLPNIDTGTKTQTSTGRDMDHALNKRINAATSKSSAKKGTMFSAKSAHANERQQQMQHPATKVNNPDSVASQKFEKCIAILKMKDQQCANKLEHKGKEIEGLETKNTKMEEFVEVECSAEKRKVDEKKCFNFYKSLVGDRKKGAFTELKSLVVPENEVCVNRDQLKIKIKQLHQGHQTSISALKETMQKREAEHRVMKAKTSSDIRNVTGTLSRTIALAQSVSLDLINELEYKDDVLLLMDSKLDKCEKTHTADTVEMNTLKLAHDDKDNTHCGGKDKDIDNCMADVQDKDVSLKTAHMKLSKCHGDLQESTDLHKATKSEMSAGTASFTSDLKNITLEHAMAQVVISDLQNENRYVNHVIKDTYSMLGACRLHSMDDAEVIKTVTGNWKTTKLNLDQCMRGSGNDVDMLITMKGNLRRCTEESTGKSETLEMVTFNLDECKKTSGNQAEEIETTKAVLVKCEHKANKNAESLSSLTQLNIHKDQELAVAREENTQMKEGIEEMEVAAEIRDAKLQRATDTNVYLIDKLDTCEQNNRFLGSALSGTSIEAMSANGRLTEARVMLDRQFRKIERMDDELDAIEKVISFERIESNQKINAVAADFDKCTFNYYKSATDYEVLLDQLSTLETQYAHLETTTSADMDHYKLNIESKNMYISQLQAKVKKLREHSNHVKNKYRKKLETCHDIIEIKDSDVRKFVETIGEYEFEFTDLRKTNVYLANQLGQCERVSRSKENLMMFKINLLTRNVEKHQALMVPEPEPISWTVCFICLNGAGLVIIILVQICCKCRSTDGSYKVGPAPSVSYCGDHADTPVITRSSTRTRRVTRSVSRCM